MSATPVTTPRAALLRAPSVRPFLLLTTLAFTGFAATLAALPGWAASQGASASSAGLVNTVMLGATVAAQLLVPATLVRLGTRLTLALGLVLLGAPALLFLLSPELPLLLGANALRGVGFAVVTVVGSVLTARLAPPGRHGEMVGLYGLAIAVPNLAVVPGAVWLVSTVGIGPVVVLAAAPLLAVPLAARLEPPRVDAEAPASEAVPAPVVRREVVRAVLAPTVVLTAVTLAGGALLAYLPVERPTGTVATVGLLLFGLTGAVARWRVGPLVDRVGARLLLPGSAVVAGAGMALCSAGLGRSSDGLLLAGAALFGGGYGVVQNLTLVLAFARAGTAGLPLASALWNAGYDAGTGLGPLVVGALVLSGLGVPGSFAVTAVLVVLLLPVASAAGASAAGAAGGARPR